MHNPGRKLGNDCKYCSFPFQRLGSIWASFEAHLDVIGPPNGAPKRLGDQNGAGKLPGLKIVIFGGQQAVEKYSQKCCFLDNVHNFSDFLGMLFAGTISL